MSATARRFFPDHFRVFQREGQELYESPKLGEAEEQVLPPPGSLLPEGIWNHLAFAFYVKNAPIKGLRCQRKVYKLSICVNTEDVVLGDFEPRDEIYVHHFADMETPKGFFVRGKFECQLLFLDDSNNKLFTIRYPFQIVKAK